MCSSLGVICNGEAFLGANYDFRYGHGLLYLCVRGLKKWSEDNEGNRLSWVNRYGSITFVQFGCELPTSGMNEAGLSIHLLEQKDSVYPKLKKDLPVLNETQWIQYQLDNFASVQEVIEGLSKIQIEKMFVSLHYALCDADGNLAIVECVEGQISVIKPLENGFIVMTNHSQLRSEEFYQEKFTERARVPVNADSLNRYFHLKNMAKLYTQDKSPKPYIWDSIQFVAIRPKLYDYIGKLIGLKPWFITYWNCVFDPVERRVEFKFRGNRKIFYLNLKELNFSEGCERQLVNPLEADQENIALNMTPYDRELNREMVNKTYAPYKRYMTPELLSNLVEYPEMFVPSGT